MTQLQNSILQNPINVLFLCTGNSARSILSEALLNDLGHDQGEARWRGYSAGSHPSGQPHPDGLAHLTSKGHNVSAYRSKSWDEFSQIGAPKMDIIITVCDNAASEVCPVWPGHPLSAHWPAPDPAHIEPLAARQSAFAHVYKLCSARIEALLALNLSGMKSDEIKRALNQIGKSINI